MKSTFEKKKINITINHLLKNDFHIGDKVRFWHPSMNSSVLGQIDVIPITKRLLKKDRKIIKKQSSVVAELNNLKNNKKIK